MSAVISPCGKYRYRLDRDGGFFGGQTAVIMVNPSTADAETDDATIRKLKGFAERNGWGNITVGNLFAYRATDVRELGKTNDPVGPLNDDYLATIALQCERVIYAWGPLAKQPKAWRSRWRKVDAIFRRNGHIPLSIGLPAKDGQPKHPLMMAYAEPILPWIAP